MYCGKCGTKVDTNDKFCPKCGASLIDEEKTIEKNTMNYKYDAFISYRHKDEEIVNSLVKLLEKTKKIDSKEKLVVFKDKNEFSSSSDLGAEIHTALNESKYLIIICSEEYQQSKWCMEELRYFRKIHGNSNERILPLLISGEPSESFPIELTRGLKTITDSKGNKQIIEVEIEPLSADIRADSLSKMKKKLKVEYLRLVSKILGVSFDSLYQRKRRQKIRNTIILAVAIVCMAISVTTYSIYMLNQVNSEKNEKYISESIQLANKAMSTVNDSPYKALEYAKESLPENLTNPERPLVDEAQTAMNSVVLTNEIMDHDIYRINGSINMGSGRTNWISGFLDAGNIMVVENKEKAVFYDSTYGKKVKEIKCDYIYISENQDYFLYFTKDDSNTTFVLGSLENENLATMTVENRSLWLVYFNEDEVDIVNTEVNNEKVLRLKADGTSKEVAYNAEDYKDRTSTGTMLPGYNEIQNYRNAGLESYSGYDLEYYHFERALEQSLAEDGLSTNTYTVTLKSKDGTLYYGTYAYTDYSDDSNKVYYKTLVYDIQNDCLLKKFDNYLIETPKENCFLLYEDSKLKLISFHFDSFTNPDECLDFETVSQDGSIGVVNDTDPIEHANLQFYSIKNGKINYLDRVYYESNDIQKLENGFSYSYTKDLKHVCAIKDDNKINVYFYNEEDKEYEYDFDWEIGNTMDKISTIRLSPDGKTLYVGSGDSDDLYVCCENNDPKKISISALTDKEVSRITNVYAGNTAVLCCMLDTDYQMNFVLIDAKTGELIHTETEAMDLLSGYIRYENMISEDGYALIPNGTNRTLMLLYDIDNGKTVEFEAYTEISAYSQQCQYAYNTNHKMLLLQIDDMMVGEEFVDDHFETKYKINLQNSGMIFDCVNGIGDDYFVLNNGTNTEIYSIDDGTLYANINTNKSFIIRKDYIIDESIYGSSHAYKYKLDTLEEMTKVADDYLMSTEN